jgi:tetratricopeptide (TPR) repeat protein
LALQLAKDMTAQDWECRFVNTGYEAQVVQTARTVLGRRKLLLVADYAETRNGLNTLLEDVAADPGIVRVLLIARAAGEWWDELREQSSSAIRSVLSGTGTMELDQPIDERLTDIELAEQAALYFSGRLRAERIPPVKFRGGAERLPVLVLHAAALASAISAQDPPGDAVVLDRDMLNELLEHEAIYWRGSARRAGLAADGTVLKRAVAVASLLRAGDEAEMAQLLTRVPDLHDAPVGQRRRYARWLQDLYPAESGRYASTLQPDLFAESHIVDQLADAPELAAACLSRLNEQHALEALTILARACAHQPRAPQIISTALMADLSHLARPAIIVATQTGGMLGDILAQALVTASATPDLLENIAAAMPHPSTALAWASLAVISRIVETLPADTDPAGKARWTVELASAMEQVGRFKDALAPAREGVSIYRELLSTSRDAYLPGLAGAVNSLGICMSEAGEPPEEALRASLESAALWREAVAMDRDRHLTRLATVLTNVGFAYHWAGRPSQALPPARESVSLWREVVTIDRERHAIDLARALGNLGQWLFELGVFGEAEVHIREALHLCREVSQTDPDRFLPDLANTLRILGTGLQEAGSPDQARRYLQEAAGLHRQLVSTHRDRYLRRLASDLAHLADCLAELGDDDEAVAVHEEALDLQRELVMSSRDQYRDRLARHLIDFAIYLDKIGKTAHLLPVLEEAADLIGEAKEQNPESQDISEITNRFFVHFGSMYSRLDLSEHARAAFAR